MNLAVLTGRQVSRPLKVFIVSEAGQVADVTLHSSCASKDDSVIKVSSSCTSVYVDGSEARGALSAEVTVRYGSLEGTAAVTVWMPQFPLTVKLADRRLSQIRGWRTVAEGGSDRVKRGVDDNRRGYNKADRESTREEDGGEEQGSCR